MSDQTRPPRHRGLAACFALALLVAACSGDDGAEVRNLNEEEDAGNDSAAVAESGSSSAPASSGPSADASADGGYEYASDVSAHRLVTGDVCGIAELLAADPIDFAGAEALYREGEHAINSDGTVRTLAGFATVSEGQSDLADYYGTPTPLDDWVSGAFAGTGRFDGMSEGARAEAIEKGIQNHLMVAWAIDELESALAKAADGDFDPSSGAPHSWDEAWAFYHGASPGCAPYSTADNRAADFGTTGSQSTAAANVAILEAMKSGRDALIAGDADGAREAADEVIRNIVITYSQATIRYAALLPVDVGNADLDTAAVHRAEGLAFFRVIEAMAADAGADVDAINAIYDLDQDLLDQDLDESDNGGAIMTALQPAWDSFGIAAADIGELES